MIPKSKLTTDHNGFALTIILFLVLFLGLVKPLWATPAEEDDSRLNVWWTSGPATAYHDERDETNRLRVSESVDEGDNISTGAKGQALLRLAGKAYVYLGPHTKIHISRLRPGEKNLQVRINLITGDIWCQLDQTPHNMIFETSMRSLICRCHGTLFEVIRQKNAARINAYDGPVVTVSHSQVKMAKTGEVTQYIQDKFRYKHRLKDSDTSRLEDWKTHLTDILAHSPIKKLSNP